MAKSEGGEGRSVIYGDEKADTHVLSLSIKKPLWIIKFVKVSYLSTDICFVLLCLSGHA